MGKIVFWIVASALSLLWLSAPLALSIGVILWLRARKTDKGRSYALLLTLAAPWLVGAFCALALRDHRAFAAEPTIGLVAEIVLATALAISLKRIRRVAIALGLLDVYVALGVWLWGSMAIQNSWL